MDDETAGVQYKCSINFPCNLAGPDANHSIFPALDQITIPDPNLFHDCR